MEKWRNGQMDKMGRGRRKDGKTGRREWNKPMDWIGLDWIERKVQQQRSAEKIK